MPRQIPYHDLLFHTLRYLVNRQVAQRPTTVFQMSKRLGYGIDHLQGLLELNQVEYVLIPHTTADDSKTTEILLKRIPETVVVELGVENAEIATTFKTAIGNIEIEAEEKSPESREKILDAIDPVAKYRIQKRTFDILKSELLIWKEFDKRLRRKGFPHKLTRNIIVIDRLYEQLSPVWRPYYYKNNIYFLKKALKATDELNRLFPNVAQTASLVKTGKYRRKKIAPDNPHLFSVNSI